MYVNHTYIYNGSDETTIFFFFLIIFSDLLETIPSVHISQRNGREYHKYFVPLDNTPDYLE